MVEGVEDLYAYAEGHSGTTRAGQQSYALARLQELAAKANTVNLKGAVTYTATDNYKLPVNFIPAEVFGGPTGTFRQITLGQQYVSQVAITPTLDLVNPSTWARVRSADYATELTVANNQLARRGLYEQIAGTYYNLLSAQGQLGVARLNLANADSIAGIMGQRHGAGLVRQQDYNNALANRLSVADFVGQLEVRVTQYEYALRALCGIPEGMELELGLEDVDEGGKSGEALKADSWLQNKAMQLQVGFQKAELASQRMAFLPTLSLVGSWAWQHNSNEGFFDGDAEWIRAQYLGLRLSLPFPTETAKWSQAEVARLNLKLAQINAEDRALQEDYANAQMNLDLENAVARAETAQAIQGLKEENYARSLLNYQEGILSADLLFTAFSEVLNSQLNGVATRWNVLYQRERILLSRRLQ